MKLKSWKNKQNNTIRMELGSRYIYSKTHKPKKVIFLRSFSAKR